MARRSPEESKIFRKNRKLRKRIGTASISSRYQ
jgi:hypothetical protein